MSQGFKAVKRCWSPGIVSVGGSFTVASSAIALSRPTRAGFTVTRKAAGVYQVTLTQAFQSVLNATAKVGPATAFATSLTNLPVTEPNGVMITQDFFTATATQMVADTTGQNLVIICYTNIGEGTIGELTANYRIGFNIDLCESAISK